MASRIRTAEKTRCAGPQRAAEEAQKVAAGFTAARNVWESTLLSTKPAEINSVKPRKESGRSERGPGRAPDRQLLKSRVRQPPSAGARQLQKHLWITLVRRARISQQTRGPRNESKPTNEAGPTQHERERADTTDCGRAAFERGDSAASARMKPCRRGTSVATLRRLWGDCLAAQEAVL